MVMLKCMWGGITVGSDSGEAVVKVPLAVALRYPVPVAPIAPARLELGAVP